MYILLKDIYRFNITPTNIPMTFQRAPGILKKGNKTKSITMPSSQTFDRATGTNLMHAF